ncbi:hypothetical protein C9374_006682 [Naegleria lovaniensis]|uniref:Protein arginine methyltransferase NDUFAF7 n=1 Tax=Naegleria lovaniensis TaxID=51637 RepID=A0AA88GMJ8_NAELO|nr:uncharacterized protein C9374_006682 [Naegleria lovaniensis]KAG2379565.1 hypothetical protein C9374_006682 [Naegleria lovaniensis]
MLNKVSLPKYSALIKSFFVQNSLHHQTIPYLFRSGQNKRCYSSNFSSSEGNERNESNVSNNVGNDHNTESNVDDVGKEFNVISIDTSALITETYDKAVVKDNETPMVKHLKNKIKGAGPISVSSFMQESLLNPIYGYYYTAKQPISSMSGATPGQKVIGREGDFVTSPEITSVFSEMIGLWCVSMWEKLGKPKALEIIELGPGKGTLMHDLLDSVKRSNSYLLKSFTQSVKQVTLIEASDALKEVQKEKLKPFMDTIEFRWENRFEKYTNITGDIPVLIIAHEFFDALPVYHFEYTERGWLEVLVDIDDSKESPNHFKFVLSPGPTMATTFVSLVEGKKEIGTIREVCAMGVGYAERMGELLHNRKGASLIIDYGNDYPMGFTLQGIYQHGFTQSPLDKPGEADLSTFVDFSSLKKAVEKFKTVRVYGPQYQSDFLHQLGMDTRFAKLLQNPKLSDEQAEAMIQSYERLTHSTQMGHHYKAMCMMNMPSKQPPSGFEMNIVPSKEETPNILSKRVSMPTINPATSPLNSESIIRKEGETSPIKKKAPVKTDTSPFI